MDNPNQDYCPNMEICGVCHGTPLWVDDAPCPNCKVDFSTREGILKEWDKWRKYIAEGGKGSWPRDAFESLLDFYEETKMDKGHYTLLMTELVWFKEKLDKIRNTTFIKDPNRKLTKEEVRKEYYPLFEPTQFDATDEAWKNCCNCGDHKHGELTGGWICPVHGQQF